MNWQHKRDQFELPDGLIYLDGNSLGPLPKTAAVAASELITQQWGERLIRGWNDCGWMELPSQVGNRVARLLGAADDTVVMGDTLSIKVYQALASALKAVKPDSKRRVVLSDTGNFPSDLYIARGLLEKLDNYELKLVEPEQVEAALDDSVAVMMLTEVDYRSGRLHDMAALTRRAHAVGALTVWDLAHSAGAIDVQLAASDADFAVGCSYKYLNGGPGAPAFIYVAPKHLPELEPALKGWLGHAAPFDFELDYRPAEGVDRMRVGTPPVVALAVLNAALDVWDGVEPAQIRARSIELSQLFIAEVGVRCPILELASPADPHARGSQVSFRFEHGYAVMQALIANNVIGDFRAPDILRFGFTPLYLNEDDIRAATVKLAEILDNRLWDTPEFKKRGAVT